MRATIANANFADKFKELSELDLRKQQERFCMRIQCKSQRIYHIYMCVYICVYIYVYIYIHTYTYIKKVKNLISASGFVVIVCDGEA